MKKYYLWLILVFGAGNPDAGELLNRFGTAKEIYDAFRNNYAAAGKEYTEKAEKVTIEEAEKLVNNLESKDITIITYEDIRYPESLKKTENPPAVIFAKGNIGLLKNKLITIAGTRKVTEYTIAVETAVCEELCNEYTFVASLCAGCEQLACLTAIKQSKGCIEILPCGFDHEYPNGTNVMRQQILMNNGCILSEFLPDTKSSNANYLKRARITGGISKAMIVFQAADKSGSLNATRYSPALFFIPPEDIFNPKYAAAVAGVRNGAKLYLSPDSLKPVFEEGYKPQHIKFESKRRKLEIIPEEKPVDISFSETKHEIPEIAAATTAETDIKNEDFDSELHASVYKMICEKGGAVLFDEVRDYIGKSIDKTSEILLDLEISGKINAVAGGRFVKV